MGPENQGLLHDKNEKTHLINYPIDICANSHQRLIKGNKNASPAGARGINNIIKEPQQKGGLKGGLRTIFSRNILIIIV
tara:strand:- start:63 stop:299 length:237 start_codon:yes stop_codon:yes gene_type:complete